MIDLDTAWEIFKTLSAIWVSVCITAFVCLLVARTMFGNKPIDPDDQEIVTTERGNVVLLLTPQKQEERV